VHLLEPATEDTCDLLFAWHITKGEFDGVDLSDLNVALAVRAPKQMTDGNWTAALYLDDRADDAQSRALATIFSGQAGGHLAHVAPLIGRVTGVEAAAITFERDGGTRRLAIGSVASAEVAEIVGMDGANPPVITNPLLGAIAQPVRQARSVSVRYDGAFSFSAEGRNSFIAEFAYAG
jgi:hypothetical protein